VGVAWSGRSLGSAWLGISAYPPLAGKDKGAPTAVQR